MSSNLEFKKVTRVIRIYAVVQFALVAMLVYMAVNFQEKLRILGRAHNFMQGVIATFVLQLALFYPINKLATKDANRDISMIGGKFTKEELKVISKKKRYSDIAKMSTFGFFIIFIMAAPADPLVLSVIYYTFVLTILTYLQCYNFAAKKLMKEK